MSQSESNDSGTGANAVARPNFRINADLLEEGPSYNDSNRIAKFFFNWFRYYKR